MAKVLKSGRTRGRCDLEDCSERCRRLQVMTEPRDLKPSGRLKQEKAGKWILT